MTDAANILGSPPPPATPPAELPEQTYSEQQAAKRQRRHIFCEHCQQYHRLPKPASEPTAEKLSE